MWGTTSFPGLKGVEWSVTWRALRRIHWISLTREVLPSARKIDKNYFFLAFRPGDKWAKPPFFVTYSRLCHHCRILAEGGCLLSRFHFTLCCYFLGHVTSWHLPLTGPHYAVDSMFCCYLLGLWVNTSPFSRVSMHWETISRDQLLSWILAEHHG